MERVLKHKKYALFMEVGTGKTFTALECIKRIHDEDFKELRVLVMCPLSAIPEWEQNINFYLEDRPIEVDVLNPEKIIRKDDIFYKGYNLIVVDEAHKIKGRVTRSGKPKISYIMRRLCFLAEYVIAMTGTPVANNEIDIFNTFNISGINEFQGYAYAAFIVRYTVVYPRTVIMQSIRRSYR